MVADFGTDADVELERSLPARSGRGLTFKRGVAVVAALLFWGGAIAWWLGDGSEVVEHLTEWRGSECGVVTAADENGDVTIYFWLNDYMGPGDGYETVRFDPAIVDPPLREGEPARFVERVADDEPNHHPEPLKKVKRDKRCAE